MPYGRNGSIEWARAQNTFDIIISQLRAIAASTQIHVFIRRAHQLEFSLTPRMWLSALINIGRIEVRKTQVFTGSC